TVASPRIPPPVVGRMLAPSADTGTRDHAAGSAASGSAIRVPRSGRHPYAGVVPARNPSLSLQRHAVRNPTGGFSRTLNQTVTNRASTPQPNARLVTVDRTFLQHVEENPYGITAKDAPLDLLRIAFSSGTTGEPKAIGLGEPWQAASDATVELRTQSGQGLMLM